MRHAIAVAGIAPVIGLLAGGALAMDTDSDVVKSGTELGTDSSQSQRMASRAPQTVELGSDSSVALRLAAADGEAKGRVLRLLDVRGTVEQLDLGRPAHGDFDPSPGDVIFFGNTLRDRTGSTAVGRFLSSCTAIVGTNFHCAGTLLLDQNGKGGKDGEDGEDSIELATTVDFAREAPIVSAVVGGTGRYAGAGGQATIAPTDVAGTSWLVVELARPT